MRVGLMCSRMRSSAGGVMLVLLLRSLALEGEGVLVAVMICLGMFGSEVLSRLWGEVRLGMCVLVHSVGTGKHSVR